MNDGRYFGGFGMDSTTYFALVILTWAMNVLFCVGLIVFLARHEKDNWWAFLASVILPILSLLITYMFNDMWMILNLLSSSIPLAAGAYLRAGAFSETSRYEKYMKINLLLIALLFVPGLSSLFISYSATHYTALAFGNLWFTILFLTLIPTFVAAGSMTYRIYNTNLLFGCLFGVIGWGISMLFNSSRDILTIPVIEILGIVMFTVSGTAFVLVFIGMVFWKPSDTDSMGKYKKFKF